MPGGRRRLVDMWDGNPVGVDLKRPILAFAVVSILCVALMVASAGSGSAVRGLFHAPKPIAAAAPQSLPALQGVAPAAAQTVAMPAELTADPVGQSASTASVLQKPAAAKAPDSPAAAKPTKASRKADKAQSKADRKAAKAQRKADRKAEKAAVKAAKKADKAAEKQQ